MQDSVLRRAFETIEIVDALCEDPSTSDADFERLLAVRTALYSEASAARDSTDEDRLRMVERLTHDAERAIESARDLTPRA